MADRYKRRFIILWGIFAVCVAIGAYDENDKERDIIKGDAANMRVMLPASCGMTKKVKIVNDMTVWHILLGVSIVSLIALSNYCLLMILRNKRYDTENIT